MANGLRAVHDSEVHAVHKPFPNEALRCRLKNPRAIGEMQPQLISSRPASPSRLRPRNLHRVSGASG